MSRYNWSAFVLSDFIDSLIHQDEIERRQMLKYESTLKYVEFPSIDMTVERREVIKDSANLIKHDEVFRILQWLADKGVTKIIKLVVPDRLLNPHDEDEMARFVRRFQVEVLDWKVLDLSISIFKDLPMATSSAIASGRDVNKNSEKKKPAWHLQELSLYSSGKRAAINHWFNKDDGIPSLNVSYNFLWPVCCVPLLYTNTYIYIYIYIIFPYNTR